MTSVLFYMYTSPHLDLSWLRTCHAYDALYESMSQELNFAEVRLYDGLVSHPQRTKDPAVAELYYYVVLYLHLPSCCALRQQSVQIPGQMDSGSM